MGFRWVEPAQLFVTSPVHLSLDPPSPNIWLVHRGALRSLWVSWSLWLLLQLPIDRRDWRMFITCPGSPVPSPLVYLILLMFLLLCGNDFPSEGLVTVDVQWSDSEKCTGLQTELQIWLVFNVVLFVAPAFQLQITCLVLLVLLSFKCVFWLFYGDTSATKWRGDPGYITATKLFISQNSDRSRKQKNLGQEQNNFAFLGWLCFSSCDLGQHLQQMRIWWTLHLVLKYFLCKKESIDPLEQTFFLEKSVGKLTGVKRVRE